jgi:hypothetical protein
VAHKGNLYPVWFRRDFSLNVFNNRGFAHTYDVNAGPFSIAGGPFADFLSWRATNDQKDAGDTRTWTLQPIVQGGITFAGFFVVTNDPLLMWTKTRLEIFTDVSLFTWAGEWQNVELPPDYQNFESVGDPTILLAKPLIQSLPGQTALEIDAVRWTDVPPP